MSVADIHTLDGIPGVVESRISRELADRLPEAPAAPWRTSGSGIAWLHRAAPKAARHHQHAALRGLNEIASRRGQTLAQLALAWAFH